MLFHRLFCANRSEIPSCFAPYSSELSVVRPFLMFSDELMTYDLFGRAANRYDWHTPLHHYQHDHAFVLSRLPALPCRVLDVGCGTGVFLEKALAAGFDAIGLDASPEMVALAAQRVEPNRVRVGQMQELSELE